MSSYSHSQPSTYYIFGLIFGLGLSMAYSSYFSSFDLAGLCLSQAFQKVSHLPATMHFQYGHPSAFLVDWNGGCAKVKINRQTPKANTSAAGRASASILSGKGFPSVEWA